MDIQKVLLQTLLQTLSTTKEESVKAISAVLESDILQNRKKLTNDRILASLQSIGVATKSDLQEVNQSLRMKVSALEKRIEELESELGGSVSSKASSTPNAVSNTAEDLKSPLPPRFNPGPSTEV